MTIKSRHDDGAVHFSALSKMAKSPAHYLAACARVWAPTRGMRIGTIVHELVLGPRAGQRVVRAPFADRRAKGWADFAAKHVGAELMTETEWREAEPVAAAVLADEIAAPLIASGKREAALRWNSAGVECATDGIDLLGADFVCDLKTSVTSEPGRLQRLALGFSYHAQLAFYLEGARENGYPVTRALVIGVETSPPYPVTVLEMTPAMLVEGQKAICGWLERLIVCENEQHFPAYTQCIVPWDVPPWLADVPDDGEEGDGEEVDAA
jgi:PDDEXK-like domain of unknown function (DUF3799)